MERPKITDKAVLAYVEHLEERLKKFEESPLVNSYLACHTTIERWNEQLIDNEIDLFADKPDAVAEKMKFEMAHKYLTEMKPYIEQLNYLRTLMTPEQVKEAEQKMKDSKVGVAEKIALKVKENGRG